MPKEKSAEAVPTAKFRTTIFAAGKTATGIVVPDDVVEKLSSGKRPAVKVTIKGHTYRSTVAPMGGKFLIGVSAEHRQHADVKAGDVVDVLLELDVEPREVTVPADFAAALGKDAKAKKFFDALSYSNKRRHVLSIEAAKTDETRQRRILKSVTMLHEGKV